MGSTTSQSQQLLQQQYRVGIRRPVCTHMMMTRVYGPYKCLHCQQSSFRGWVYKCMQDEDRMQPFLSRGIDYGMLFRERWSMELCEK